MVICSCFLTNFARQYGIHFYISKWTQHYADIGARLISCTLLTNAPYHAPYF